MLAVVVFKDVETRTSVKGATVVFHYSLPKSPTLPHYCIYNDIFTL